MIFQKKRILFNETTLRTLPFIKVSLKLSVLSISEKIHFWKYPTPFWRIGPQWKIRTRKALQLMHNYAPNMDYYDVNAHTITTFKSN